MHYWNWKLISVANVTHLTQCENCADLFFFLSFYFFFFLHFPWNKRVVLNYTCKKCRMCSPNTLQLRVHLLFFHTVSQDSDGRVVERSIGNWDLGKTLYEVEFYVKIKQNLNFNLTNFLFSKDDTVLSKSFRKELLRKKNKNLFHDFQFHALEAYIFAKLRFLYRGWEIFVLENFRN